MSLAADPQILGPNPGFFREDLLLIYWQRSGSAARGAGKVYPKGSQKRVVLGAQRLRKVLRGGVAMRGVREITGRADGSVHRVDRPPRRRGGEAAGARGLRRGWRWSRGGGTSRRAARPRGPTVRHRPGGATADARAARKEGREVLSATVPILVAYTVAEKWLNVASYKEGEKDPVDRLHQWAPASCRAR